MPYKTEDGKIFDSMVDAEFHQKSINNSGLSAETSIKLKERKADNQSNLYDYFNQMLKDFNAGNWDKVISAENIASDSTYRLYGAVLQTDHHEKARQIVNFVKGKLNGIEYPVEISTWQNEAKIGNKIAINILGNLYLKLGNDSFDQGDEKKAISSWKQAVYYCNETAITILKNKGINYTNRIDSQKSTTPKTIFTVDDNFTGKGKKSLSNGDVYDGDFVKGNRHGNGKLISKSGHIYYDGNWVNDKQNGKGKWSNTKGDIYEGDFRDGYFHGKGKKIYADGRIEEGRWKEGEFKGKGFFG